MSRAQRRACAARERHLDPEQPLPAFVLEHHQAGRLVEAEAVYRQVLATRPRHPDALHLLGVVAYQTGRPALAAHLISLAIAENPNAAMFHSNLGNALKQLARPADAIAALLQAVSLEPSSADFQYNLGLTLQDADQFGEAAARFRAAVGLRPSFPEAHDSLGAALRELGRYDDAVACHRAALALRPRFLNAMSNLGTALRELGRLNDAAECYATALAIDPGFPDGHYNLGVVLQEKGQVIEAAACYRRAIAARPAFAEARFNLAMVMLSQGNLAEGWREYEWRWKTSSLGKAYRDFVQPLWKGEAGGGRTLLVHAEQGLGDTIQFCRYVPLAAAMGFKVVTEAQPALARLLRGVPGIGPVIVRGEDLPPFDVHCPMLSLPLALGTTLETVPIAGPYLRADPFEASALGARLLAVSGNRLRVGLVWAGAPAMKADRRRSLPPGLLSALSTVPGIDFVSLQKAEAAPPAGFPVIDFMAEMRDFADTAALVANLDLVISVDTAVAHLAAGMGKQVWLLNRFDPCWRWLSGRRDTPWYPTMRLYRQPVPGDWGSILADVRRDLAAL